MVGGSFAAAPASSEVSKVGSYGGYMPSEIVGLNSQTCKAGQTAKFSGRLHYLNGLIWTNGIWRYMTLKVYNNKGVELSSETKMNNIFTAVGHFNVNTREMSLNPGIYNVVMSYEGNDVNGINPCESSCTLTVTS
jgi:hypothetical protein